MQNVSPTLLLCTNGDPHSRPALEYGVWLAGVINVSVELLGVVEALHERKLVEGVLEETSNQLEQSGIAYSTRIDQGNATQVIASCVSEGRYLTVVGPLGRPTWRRVLHGRSIRRIMEKIATPIVYVRKPHPRLDRILLCMGGLGYASSMEQAALYLAQAAGAKITLLHVVEPVTLEYPTAKEIQDHWQTIMETDTPQGRNLRNAMAAVEAMGLSANLKVKRGSIVREILEEGAQGNYDLIGLGSPYSAQSLRHLYMPNVTAEVAESFECPILTVRQGYGLFNVQTV